MNHTTLNIKQPTNSPPNSANSCWCFPFFLHKPHPYYSTMLLKVAPQLKSSTCSMWASTEGKPFCSCHWIKWFPSKLGWIPESVDHILHLLMVSTYWNSYEKPYSLLTFDPTVGVGRHIESSSMKDYVSTSAKGFLYVTDRPLILDQGYKILILQPNGNCMLWKWIKGC